MGRETIKLQFSIPRDMELGEGLKITTDFKEYNITTELKKRHLVAKGIDAEKTTATVIANKDMHGNVYQTEFEITFDIKKDFGINFDIDLDKKGMDEFIKTARPFLISKSIEEINKLIRVHQYVNNKYFVFPISESELSDIKVQFPDDKKLLYFSSPSILVMKGGPNKDLIENTKKVMEFFNNNHAIISPIYLFGYAKQFFDMDLYRVAITEAQAAIEYLLDIILTHGLRNRKDDSLKFYKKSKEKADLIDVKLGLYLRMVTGTAIEKDLKRFKALKSAVKLRNNIVHGSKDRISKEEATNAMQTYDELFFYLLNLKTEKKKAK